jgi:hypothetical protein
LLGTEIEYSPTLFRWKNYSVRNPSAATKVMTADEFSHEYSGGGPADSQVDFKQLGIRSSSITMVYINHAAANITGGTVETPGDTVLLKSKERIVLSVCNVYFEAVRSRK